MPTERTLARGARLLVASAAIVVSLAGASALAAPTIKPSLGRWEGQAGPARVLFTVEETSHGARYMVRPVVYCDPGNSMFFETSLFNLLQPDAWPISHQGLLRNSSRVARSAYSPLTGRFQTDRAKLTVAADGTCVNAGTRFTAEAQPAHPTVPDGNWTVEIAPHQKGILGEFATFRTRGEGATVDTDWGVYDGLESCYFQRSPLELLVESNGSFDATINGNELSSELRTIHITGSFLSSNTVRGSYTITGLGCTGAPVEFSAVLTSAYVRPKPPFGSVTLTNPRHGPGGGGETGGEGAECKDAATLSPRFAPEEKREIPLGSFSVDELPLKVSGSLSLGSVGICQHSLESTRADLTRALTALDVQAVYDRGARKVNSLFRYTFLPLGWQLPGGTGAPEPDPPVIDWPTANLTLPGGIEGQGLNFVYSPGKPIAPELELVKVPILQETVTLIALGHPFLSVRMGPELSLSLQINEKELDKDVNQNVAEGEDAQTAARQTAEEVETKLTEGIDAQEQALTPEQAPPAELGADATEIATNVGDGLAAELPAETGGPIADRVAASAIARGLLGESPGLVGEAEEIVGPEILEIGEITIASARHRASSGIRRTDGGPPVSAELHARAIRRLSRHALHRAAFPVRRIPALIKNTFALPVPARVGPLAVTTRRLRPAGTVTVIAPFLGVSEPHDALLVLTGPGYRATRLLRVTRGAAGATIRLPRRLARGTWTISIEDLSDVALAPDSQTLTGNAIVRIGVFRVR